MVGLFFLVVVCALFQKRPRPDAYSHEELSQIRIDRELAKEVRIDSETKDWSRLPPRYEVSIVHIFL